MIAAILNSPWLKLWPVAAALVAFAAGWHEGSVRCEADKADRLATELRGYQDEIDRLSAAATRTEAERAAIETRNRELQRSLNRASLQALDDCPVPDDLVRALRESRVRPAAGEPDR